MKQKTAPKKNPAAVALGKLGGRAYVESHSPQEIRENAIKAAKAPRKPDAPRCLCGEHTAKTAINRRLPCKPLPVSDNCYPLTAK